MCGRLAYVTTNGYTFEMRRFLLHPVSCVAFFVFALSFISDGHAKGNSLVTPLPDDVRVEPAGPNVGPPFARMAGAWQGELEIC